MKYFDNFFFFFRSVESHRFSRSLNSCKSVNLKGKSGGGYVNRICSLVNTHTKKVSKGSKQRNLIKQLPIETVKIPKLKNVGTKSTNYTQKLSGGKL